MIFSQDSQYTVFLFAVWGEINMATFARQADNLFIILYEMTNP
ncbi:hypothetical protein BANRA_03222 [Klebsiella quasipneumoniae]|nr:hypothetical protein BANRA_03222 [Klebsiella quasipneumoniae]